MTDDSLSRKRKLGQIASEFEANWKPDQRPDFDAYLNRIDENHRGELLEVLLEVDIEVRRKRDLPVDASDYSDLGDEAKQIVTSLLANANRESATIPPSGEPGETATLPPSGKQTQEIGPYKLLQQIGEGGMGTVWMAEQEKPVRRRVALKLIRADVGSKETIARFEAERQALAMMDHQNIAKVLDAGTNDDGNPYFVMELVKGIPLTQFCDDNKLSIRERLELFVPICKAIQHAHQKGIVHRDLKPSNVLVTLYDGEAVSKVIDFGLAKALEHTTKLTDKTMFTEFGKVVGTLQYMSPEQAEMNALDVDTRTDIYSLGVMLYELLTGSTPLDNETLGKNALFQVLAIIKEKEPPKPSHRLSSSTDTITGISQRRKIAPSKLQQILRGELDWVVMKALEKDRRRRYENASNFAQDIERYLNDEAVEARPPSTGYRVRKFVKKNRGLVATLTSFAAMLIGAAVVSGWFAFDANLARKKADTKTTEASKAKAAADKDAKNLRDSLDVFISSFESSDPEVGASRNMLARQVLDNAYNTLQQMADFDPLTKAAMLHAIGKSYLGLGDHKQAKKCFESSLHFRSALLGRDDRKTLESLNNLALAHGDAQDFEKAILLYRELVHLSENRYGENDLLTLGGQIGIAGAYLNLDPFCSISIIKETLPILNNELGPTHEFALLAKDVLGRGYKRIELYPQAIELQEWLVDHLARKFKPDHLVTLRAMNSLGATYLEAELPKDALRIFEDCYSKCQSSLDENHPIALSALHNLAMTQAFLKDYVSSISNYKIVLTAQSNVWGDTDAATMKTKTSLASTYAASGNLKKANQLFSESVNIHELQRGKNDIRTIGTLYDQAVAFHNAGDAESSLPIYEKCLVRCLEGLGQTHGLTIDSRTSLANALVEVGQKSRASKLFEENYEVVKKFEIEKLDRLKKEFVDYVQRNGKNDEAVNAFFSSGAEGLIRNTYENNREIQRLYNDYGSFLVSEGKNDSAAKVLKKLVLLRMAMYGLDHPKTLSAKKQFQSLKEKLKDD